jgi:hypothetical protein
MEIQLELDDPKYMKESRKGRECGNNSLFWVDDRVSDCLDELLVWKREHEKRKFKCCACRKVFEELPCDIGFYLFKGRYTYVTVCRVCEKTGDWVERYRKASINFKTQKVGVLNWQKL